MTGKELFEMQGKALRGAELKKILIGKKNNELYRYVLVHGDNKYGYLASSEEWISIDKYPEFSEVRFVTPFFDSTNEAEEDAIPDAIESAQKDGFELVGRTSVRGFFDKLADFQVNATPKMFETIFGDSGNHIWGKFQKHDANIIALYQTLDSENKMVLTDYVEREL